MPKTTEPTAAISLEDARRVIVGQHDDPFAVLGPHAVGKTRYVTAFDPGAATMSAVVSNTNSTAVLMPAAFELAKKGRFSPSRLLMPLAFAGGAGSLCRRNGACLFVGAR